MDVEDIGTVTNARGLLLHLRRWPAPEGPAESKGTLVIIHGFSWHTAYFSELAVALQAKGFSVFAADLQGHGRSEALKGMRGYADRFDDFVDDSQLVLDQAYDVAAGAPLFLLGESLGGSIALRLMERPAAREKVQGLVLLAPVVKVAAAVLPPKPILFLMRLLAYFFPRLPLPTNEVADTFDTAFGDPDIAARAHQDPLVVFDPPRLRMAVEILGACKKICANMEGVSVPLLVMHGTNDLRTELRNSEELVRRASSSDKTLKVVEGACHQLLQDKRPITESVIADIVRWVSERRGRVEQMD